MSASVEGIRELERNFRRTNLQVSDSTGTALAKAGMTIIAEAQRNLRANGTNNTGVLSSSGKVVKVDDDTVNVGFMADESGESHQTIYAEFVEYGRRAGRWPPFWAIYQWVRKKLRLKDREAKTRAFLIQRSIGKKGTRPHPFFWPAVKSKENEIEKVIATEIGKALR